MSNWELNKGDNFIFAVDVSMSMNTKDVDGITRIEALKEKVISFVEQASKYDEDGIDVIAFGKNVTPHYNVTAENAKTIIGGLQANEGSTDTAGVIRAAYARHKEVGSGENTFFFLATDGEPSDREAVKQAIIEITNDIKDEHEFAIGFLTVGKIDAGLQAFLTGLDDDLSGAKYDIVDVKALEDVTFDDAVFGALHD